MLRFDLTLDSPEANLALDESLLLDAEAGELEEEVLRIWQPTETFLVLGRSSKYAEEANLSACEQDQIKILRRTSGGAAIVTGPGCLMYAVVLSLTQRPDLRMINRAHRFVLGKTVAALSDLVSGVDLNGTSDLVIGPKKFSGNSLQIKRNHLIYHGTLMYDFPIEKISQYLLTPPRMPEYRENRSHADFVCNLAVSQEKIKEALIQGWEAEGEKTRYNETLVQKLIHEKYSQSNWNQLR